MRTKLLSLLAVTSLLAACTTAKLEELRHTEPKGNAFQTALSKQYLAFADSEAKAYDWMSMKIFSEKGLSAAYGNDPLPEVVDEWKIDAEKALELAAARMDLMEMLTASNKNAKPDALATAQFSFDCWVEQQHEGWQVDDIAGCRNRFFTAMNELKGEVSTQTESSSYLVLFDFGSAKLNAKGAAVVKEAADETRDDSSDIILNGHTDRVGSDRTNMELSEKRIDAVGALLIKYGVQPTRIRECAFGESDPAVSTPDGVKERRNRRVEIFIGQ
jgi:OOP family OmpA-OmpF porin